MSTLRPDSTDTARLLDQIGHGDAAALNRLLERHRPALLAFVAARLDLEVRGRVDPSDVVQEAQLDAVRRLPDYLERRPMPFHLWLRKAAYQRLLNARREHRAARRSVARELALPEDSSLLLARPLLGQSVSEAILAREQIERVTRAVGELSDSDQEILLMRHAEDLSYEEVGCLLDIEPVTARKRYGRALLRLRQVLREHGLLESRP